MALNCIKCNRHLDNREKDGKDNDPWYGVVFQNMGNHGSMEYTEEDIVEINVCDSCMVETDQKMVAKVDDVDVAPRQPKLRLIQGENDEQV